jgi:uncharacterized protein (DUF169 family)
MGEEMTRLMLLESTLNTELELTRRPVAVSFLDAPPPGVDKFTGTEPSGCSFWRLAGKGRRFYTVPADHFNCPIGSHTHSIALPQQRQKELGDTLSFLTEIGYISLEEVGRIPTLPRQPNVVTYAPLGEAATAPDVVILVGKPGKIMLLTEAAVRAGVTTQFPVYGRPTCMTIPAAMQSGVVGSSGCIGNRVYTEIGDDELYVAIRGGDLENVVRELETIINANGELREYHRTRKKALTKD